MIKEGMNFIKVVASGNDFILFQAPGSKLQAPSLYKKLARKYCRRKFEVGADGLLVIESSKKALFKMRIFNPDGSEAEMCGNGARCAALWASFKFQAPGSRLRKLEFETKAGIIQAQVSNKRNWGEVKIKMVNPFNLRLDLPIKIFKRKIKVNRINTGVPHAVIFVEGIDKIDVERIGREVRFHRAFRPTGTNVDFVEIINDKFIKIRTYERGVEAETFACGTGVVASAVVTSYKLPFGHTQGRQAALRPYSGQAGRKYKIRVLTKGGEILKVYFDKDKDEIDNVWFEGRAYLVYEGWINTD